MSAPVMHPPAPDAERLERLEAAFLRSPSPTWPPAAAVTVELPVRGTPEQPGEPDAWLSQYRTYGLCCKR